ncbi:uncharacterized protein [Typha angustifolia]|uniref:uncharacterized protein n=1 Tax=Typha angustifolia TaxID=59011 RepID=UPI003C2BFC6E
MECNKDEALRAKEIAEKKFTAKDIAGAKKFAIKAQTLFPALEGINQMIATLDVYLASEVNVSGEKDWYRILCLSASADDDTVKKQYRRLALQLHPDKNKSIGAEGAFQLISEAWNVLSDKSKRMSYDQKRNAKVFQKNFQEKKGSTIPSTSNGFYNFAANVSSKPRAHRHTASAIPATAAPSPRPPKSNTFWTSCNQCKMQYEYLRVYLNHNLLCPNCHEPFIAAETGAPTNGTSSAMPWSATQQCQQNSSHTSMSRKNTSSVPGTGASGSQKGANLGACNNSNFQWGPFSRTAGTASATASSAAAAQAANMVHQTYEKVRRKREEAQAAAKKEEAVRRKHSASKRNFSVSENINLGTSDSIPAKRRRGVGVDTEQVPVGIRNSVPDSASGFKVLSGNKNRCFNSSTGASEVDNASGVFVDLFKTRYSARPANLSKELPLDIRGTLMEKTKLALHKKLDGWNRIKSEFEEKEKAKKKEKLKQNAEKGKDVLHGNVTAKDTLDDASSNFQKDPPKHADSNSEDNEPISIDVPDPDFHDFDSDRSESSFQNDQIWATYDEEDGMPRYYALVQKVISLTPFKIRMSYLTSKSNSEFGHLNWILSGFAKTCGDFRVGRYEVIDTLNIFSHRVRWEKGPRGIIKILPKKGDVWALYRNWSQDWDEHTPDDVIYKYDMVEVLDEYNEDQGISVIPLVKVPEFKTVFQRHVDPKEVKRVPREEMFRFSHQVPSYLLTGEEAHNAPKGCHELDPAATPLELLQVITEIEDTMAVDKKES